MSIGERICELRRKNEISQAQLADALSVSRQAVSKWERDLSSPDTINLIKLSDILNTDVEYLATGRTPVYEQAPIILNVVKTVDKVVEKVVEKPVLKRVTRIKYLRNPLEFIITGAVCFLFGFLLGKLL